MDYGYVKVAAAVPRVTVADCAANAAEIERQTIIADGRGIRIIAFPELCLTGYTCGDLFAQQLLLEEAEAGLLRILSSTRQLGIVSIVGMPLAVAGALLNVAVVVQRGRILGIVPKTYLPNYKEFYEMRWFASGRDVGVQSVRLCGQTVPVGTHLLFEAAGATFGIELCEDVWAPAPPSEQLALQGAEIIFNLSADNECVGKHAYLRSLLCQQSARCLAGYVFSSCGFGESTQDVVFAGNGLIYENGVLLAESQRFSLEPQVVVSEIDVEFLRTERRVNTTFASCRRQVDPAAVTRISAEPVADRELTLTRTYDPHPFVPTGPALDERCQDIFSIQTSGLAKRLVHTHAKSAVVGISGGLDSTLALLVCVQAFDRLGWPRRGIIGVTMPGFGTTDRTHSNAVRLMESLGVTVREISITKACIQHFADIGHDASVHDVTYENSQARERTQLLMDIANQTGGLVIGTGDLSELALGWATYNGDHMSMYGVNVGVPKTLVRHLVTWVAGHVDPTSRATLLDIVATPISPELIPACADGTISQVTEDLVGPYELHDFFLYHFLRCAFRPAKVYFLATRTFRGVYTDEVIKKWLITFLRRFFAQQFKRSCLPDGPKVGSVSLSPRGDWRMPSDASSALWVKEAEAVG